MYDIIYIWNLKNKTNELDAKQKQTPRDNKLVVTRGEREEGRGNIGLWHMIFLLKKKNLNSQIHLGFRQWL